MKDSEFLCDALDQLLGHKESCTISRDLVGQLIDWIRDAQRDFDLVNEAMDIRWPLDGGYLADKKLAQSRKRLEQIEEIVADYVV